MQDSKAGFACRHHRYPAPMWIEVPELTAMADAALACAVHREVLGRTGHAQTDANRIYFNGTSHGHHWQYRAMKRMQWWYGRKARENGLPVLEAMVFSKGGIESGGTSIRLYFVGDLKMGWQTSGTGAAYLGIALVLHRLLTGAVSVPAP